MDFTVFGPSKRNWSKRWQRWPIKNKKQGKEGERERKSEKRIRHAMERAHCRSITRQVIPPHAIKFRFPSRRQGERIMTSVYFVSSPDYKSMFTWQILPLTNAWTLFPNRIQFWIMFRAIAFSFFVYLFNKWNSCIEKNNEIYTYKG